MNSRLWLLIAVLISVYSTAKNQSIIPEGKSVKIDGIIEKGEWFDSKGLQFEELPFVSSSVCVKHDGKNLIIAYFNDKIVDTSYLYPEIFIDTKLNKGSQWKSDDYWFHVSAQDCHAVGERENFINCRPDHTEWKAVPNHPFGYAYEAIEAFEIVISFDFISVEVGDKIGLCFSQMVQPRNHRMMYPHDANENAPETWLEFRIAEDSESAELFNYQLTFFDNINECTPTFSADGREMFYAIQEGNKYSLWFSSFENNLWTTPEKHNLNTNISDLHQPFVSYDGQELYFISYSADREEIFWRSLQTQSGWQTPILTGWYVSLLYQ